MTTFREFQAELERLHQQSESARRREKGEALERIRALIAEYRIEPKDLGLVADSKDPTTSKAGARSATKGNGSRD